MSAGCVGIRDQAGSLRQNEFDGNVRKLNIFVKVE